MDQAPLFERLWTGAATLEEWTAAVAGGSVTPITDGIIAIHTGYLFGNATAIRTDAGLVLVDTGSRETASQTLAALRRWDDGPVHTVIYTHGHIDHSWGARLLDREAEAKGIAPPRIVAHRNVLYRFDRYDATHGLNSLVMGRQFNQPGYTFPEGHRRPDEVYDDALVLTIGGVRIELFHGRGETDDATFVWLPAQRVLASGDFVIWVFPNAGNPRKVQRYAPDWGVALRRMQGLKPETLIPGHGPAIFGAARAAQLLGDGAEVLECLTDQTLALMNSGHSLDDILQAVVPRCWTNRICGRNTTIRNLSSAISGIFMPAGSTGIRPISNRRRRASWPRSWRFSPGAPTCWRSVLPFWQKAAEPGWRHIWWSLRPMPRPATRQSRRRAPAFTNTAWRLKHP